jgi:hypothetical protein
LPLPDFMTSDPGRNSTTFTAIKASQPAQGEPPLAAFVSASKACVVCLSEASDLHRTRKRMYVELMVSDASNAIARRQMAALARYEL